MVGHAQKHIHNEARRFAQNGYTAFIADMYARWQDRRQPEGRRHARRRRHEESARDARALSMRLARCSPSMRRWTRQQIGAAGYCFGGTVALNMARAGADLAGRWRRSTPASSTNTPAPSSVKAKVLVLNGADDPLITPGQVEAFKSMDAAERKLPHHQLSRRGACLHQPGSDQGRGRSSTCRSLTTPRSTTEAKAEAGQVLCRRFQSLQK